MDIRSPSLNRLLDSWLDEDLGRGDLSSVSLNKHGSAYWLAKQSGVFCGGTLAKRIFQRLDTSIEVDLLRKEGEYFQKGQRLLEVHGPTSSLA